eukprot:3938136-Rhodomonas_salina.1
MFLLGLRFKAALVCASVSSATSAPNGDKPEGRLDCQLIPFPPPPNRVRILDPRGERFGLLGRSASAPSFPAEPQAENGSDDALSIRILEARRSDPTAEVHPLEALRGA